MPFLSHKSPEYKVHFDRSFDQRLDELESRYYVASLAGGQPVSHVMVAGAHGFGIFAHVYTAPRWRRQGAFGQLLAVTMADVPAAGFRWLTLVARPDGTPFQIYRSAGFRPLAPGHGEMCWTGGPALGPGVPAPAGDLTVRPTRWGDWGAYNLVVAHPPEPAAVTPRSAALGIDQHGSAEGSFLRLVQELDGHPAASSRVLAGAAGGIAGWCHVVRSPLPLGGSWLLDLHVRPGFEAHLPSLLASVQWPAAPVAFLSTGPAPAYAPHLHTAGFADPVTVPGLAAGGPGELGLWVRGGDR